MDSTTPIQQGPPPTPSPGKNCLLTMALSGAIANDCHIGLVQRHDTELHQKFVSLSIVATAGLRKQNLYEKHLRLRISQAPAADLRIPLGFPMHDSHGVIVNGIFYYAHVLCVVQTSDLMTAIGLHAPGRAMEYGIRTLCTSHQIAIMIKKRTTVGLEADTVVCVRLHKYDTVFPRLCTAGFSIPLFERPTIGIYANGDILLSHASFDTPRLLESRSFFGEIRNWLQTAKTMKVGK